MEFRELSWHDRGRLWLRLLIRVILTVLFLLVCAKVGAPVLSFCMPFVLALIVTWVLEPMVRFLLNKTILSRKAISILVILLICGIVGGVLSWFGYKIFVEVSNLSSDWTSIWNDISAVFSQFNDVFNDFLAFLPSSLQETAGNLTTQFFNWLTELGTTSLIPKTTSAAIKIPSVALSVIFFFMATYFIMADYPRIGAVFTNWMPYNLKAFLRFIERTFQVAFGGYLRAELLLSVVVFFILIIGFVFMRLPYALLLALFLAVLDFIPIIGAGTVLVPWAIIELVLGNWTRPIQLMIIWGIIVFFRRVAEPRFLGTMTGLHPALSLLSIFVGMRAFGVLGMILAPTIFLVIINVCASGVFDGFIADVTLAFQDTNAFLQHDRKDKP